MLVLWQRDFRRKKFKKIRIRGGGSQIKILADLTAAATNKEIISGPVEAMAAGNIKIQTEIRH